MCEPSVEVYPDAYSIRLDDFQSIPQLMCCELGLYIRRRDSLDLNGILYSPPLSSCSGLTDETKYPAGHALSAGAVTRGDITAST